MRVSKIEVQGLFGIFDHAIPLNLDDHITIIHGPNGFGKTILLQMVHGLLKGSIDPIIQIPFRRLQITFESDGEIWIEKDVGTKDAGVEDNNQIEISNGQQQCLLNIQEYRDVIPEIIRSELSFLHRLDGVQTGSDWMLEPHEVFEMLGDHLPKYRPKNMPEWWLEIRTSINIHLVETQRLLRISQAITKEKVISEISVLVVQQYAQELSQTIQKKIAHYTKVSQELDQTFPRRLTEQFGQETHTNKQLQRQLQDLENQRKQLREVGLLNGIEEIATPDINEDIAGLMVIYIQDMQKKLNILDDLAQKIKLFKDIINERFLYKHIEISNEKGFFFKTKNDTSLPVTALSSGEQHELVLFYQLIFRTPQGSLILIDEPELSLHVVWQQHFLRDLQRIIALSPFDVLMATHSPQIIHDRWDLTVELEGTPGV